LDFKEVTQSALQRLRRCNGSLTPSTKKTAQRIAGRLGVDLKPNNYRHWAGLYFAASVPGAVEQSQTS
jgi:hypothetical protein